MVIYFIDVEYRHSVQSAFNASRRAFFKISEVYVFIYDLS